MRELIWAAIFLLVTLCSCGDNHIQRTDLGEWKTIILAPEGVTIDVPEEADGLHLHHKSTGFGDATWYITIVVERKDRAAFDEPNMPSPKNRAFHNSEYMHWLRWLTSFHPEISEYDARQAKEYRRDLLLNNGDVVSAHIRYHHASFNSEERVKDIEAIRRILRSIRPVRDLR